MTEITSTQINQAVANLLRFSNENSISDDDQTTIVQSDNESSNINITQPVTSIIRKSKSKNYTRTIGNCVKCNTNGHRYENCPTYTSSIIYQLDSKNTIINKYDNMKDLLKKNPKYMHVNIYKSLTGFTNSSYKYKWRWADTIVDSNTENPTAFINYNEGKYKCPKCKVKGHQYNNCPKYSSSIIYKCNNSGTIITTYDSMKDVLDKNSTYKQNNIYKALAGYSNNAYGFKWKWNYN